MAFTGPAHAEAEPDRFVLAAGIHNVDDNMSIHRESDFRVEWRMASLPLWKLHPWLGAEFISRSASWFGAGLETDIDLYRDLVYLTLQTGVGYFDDGSHTYPWRNINPPSGLEFRHQLELGVKFPQGNRVGLGISHMSNGGIGGGANPGKNSLTVNFHIPLGVSVGKISKPID